jgi:hypothetical protein
MANMRYFTWQEPQPLVPESKLYAMATITASEQCIIEACKYRYANLRPDLTLADSQLLDDFVVVHWAWETDEHGKKLR